MKKLIFLLLGLTCAMHAMEAPKKRMRDQQTTRAADMATVRSFAATIATNRMCQPIITPITATELYNALDAHSNPLDKRHDSKRLQLVASLIQQEDELLQTIDHYQEALTLRTLIDERITSNRNQRESDKTSDTTSMAVQQELLENLTHLGIAFTKKDAQELVAACHASVTTLTTAPHVFLNPTTIKILEITQEYLIAIIEETFNQTTHPIASLIPHFKEIMPLKACYGYLYPLLQTLNGTIAFMSESENMAELEDRVHDTKSISKIASALDVAGLHTWHTTNKVALHQFYNLILEELAQLPYNKTYGKNLFKEKCMLTPLADGTIADGTIAAEPIVDGPSTSAEKKPTLTEAERDYLAMELIAELDAHKKTLKEKHTATTRKKGRKHSSPTAASSSSSSSSSSSRDATPELDSDSEVEETVSTEFDPESAFVKSALASHKEKSSSPATSSIATSSPTASSSSASSSSASSSSDSSFVYKERTTVWQKSSWLPIVAEMTSRGHTMPYAQFHDLTYHRLPFVLEHVFKDFAQRTLYTSPKSNRHYDVFCFEGAVIVDGMVFHDKFIAGKTVYGTFEISCSRNTRIVVHRHFRPYTAESIVSERPIDTHGKTRTQNCMGHRYTITENAQNILIKELRSPVNVTYVIFKSTAEKS